MGIELPPITKFIPSLDAPERLFDMSKDDIQDSLSQVLRAAIYLRRKKIYIKKESKKRRIHSVLARARKLAFEYSTAIQNAAIYLDLDQLWDLIENSLHNRIKRLLHFLTNYNDSILKSPHTNTLYSNDISDINDTNSSLNATNEKFFDEDQFDEKASNDKNFAIDRMARGDNLECGEDEIPLDMEDMERFVSQNMSEKYDENGFDLFDSLGEESDGSVAARDMRYSDFFDPISVNSGSNFMDKKDIERELVAPKHWSMRGEVRGKDRPKDSLLELDLDFLYNHKDAVNVTTLAEDGGSEVIPLEMIIRQRIESKVFDNVEPKLFSIDKIRQERNADASKDVELDFSKSDKGLADIYAEKYQKEIERINKGGGEEMPREKVEIADLFSKILYKLDALSNQHFMPMVPISTATKSGDDIVPIIVSVPNDTYISKEKVKDKGEMTREERKSLRRLNKERFSKKMIKKRGIDSDKNIQESVKVKKIESKNRNVARGKLKTAELLQNKVSLRNNES